MSTRSSKHAAGEPTITSVRAAVERWSDFLRTCDQIPEDAISRFLPPPDATEHDDALAELLAVELQHRIRRGEPFRTETMVKRFARPTPEHVLLLVKAEIRARHAAGEAPKLSEYMKRFPRHRDALTRLTSRSAEDSGSVRVRPKKLKAGQKLGDYKIVCPLGSGSQADVYLAKQLSLGRDVALKISLGPQGEGRALGKLDHPNIVQVHSQHAIGEHRLLVMRYVPGKTLADLLQYYQDHDLSAWTGEDLLQWVRQDNPHGDDPESTHAATLRTLPLKTVFCYIARDLALALAHAHHRGVLHLDVKPSNVLLDTQGRGLLMDFNVALLPDESGIQRTRPAGGTLAYMPPEQLSHFSAGAKSATSQIDTRTDLYALGIMFYELLAGVSPWPLPADNAGASAATQLLAQRMQPHAALADVSPNIDNALAAVVDRLLKPLPTDRYASAQELSADLSEWIERDRLKPHKQRAGWLTPTSGRVLGIGVVAGVAVSLAVLIAGPRLRENHRPSVTSSDANSSTEPTSQGEGDGPDRVVPPPASSDIPPISEVLQSIKPATLASQVQSAMRSGKDFYAEFQPVALYRSTITDSWQRTHDGPLQSKIVGPILAETVTEVLFAQMVIHARRLDSAAAQATWDRLPPDHLQLPLLLALRDRLTSEPMTAISSKSLSASAESEFERHLLGVMSAVRADYDEAYAMLSRSFEERPDRMSTAFLLALCAERAGHSDEAVTAYQAVMTRRPEFLPAPIGLIRMYARNERWREAREVVQQVRQRMQQANRIPPRSVAMYLRQLDRLVAILPTE